MDSLISFLCLCTFFVPTAFGIGITLLLKRSIGDWAYLTGWLLPPIVLAGLYGIYFLWMRATPCEPAGSLQCGEPAAYALILFMGIFILTAIANTFARGGLFLFFLMRGQAQSGPQ
jgi:hypothetical protein